MSVLANGTSCQPEPPSFLDCDMLLVRLCKGWGDMAVRRDRSVSSQVLELGALEGRRSTDTGHVSNRRVRTSGRRSDAFWELDIAKQPIIPEPFRSHFSPPKTVLQWRDFLFARLPILHWLWIYKVKWIIGDLIAGITIGITHIPQGT